ncbi:Small-subunit processome, Utp12, partial [Dillenia turbinata]
GEKRKRKLTETPGPNLNRNLKEKIEDNVNQDLELDTTVTPTKKKKKSKKRSACDPDSTATDDKFEFVDDPNEPTMGEKLASLKLIENREAKSPEAQDSSLPIKPPSADSVHILVKQALHSDDHTLLLDCLYTQDEKVINNSTSVLNPSDVFKLLNYLISIIQSRGAVLACAIPWLRSLLLQNASIIVSQESSLHALDSLYQVAFMISP